MTGLNCPMCPQLGTVDEDTKLCSVCRDVVEPEPTRCTNSEPGTFNHECDKPATWIGVHHSGHRQAFCDPCKAEGAEARRCVSFERLGGAV